MSGRAASAAAAALTLLLAFGAPQARGDVAPSAPTPAPAVDPLDAEFAAADEAASASGFPDPLEPVNRRTLVLNQRIDEWVFDPLTHAYRAAVPEPARDAIRRLLTNLNAPRVMVNDFLQREWTGASFTISRFVVNTTVGVGGLFDVARHMGMPGHDADFGQTLALWGVTSGPYLIVPVLGPTTVRDGFGSVVDAFFRPTLYLLGPADQIFYTTVHGGSSGFVDLESHEDAIEALEASSIDYYAALRNAYYQDRVAQIWRRRGGVPAAVDDDVQVAGAPAAAAPSAGDFAGGEVGDLPVDGRDQSREAFALKD